ncbi:hypothetical protein SAMN04488518_108289 [Pseudovibrio ascidiaceicola]|uniref:Uncharacterized protein n=1 Tax=Pseudovibrio ascidiaceicola TaxID=285279 RepID=A0A1I4C0Z8_9HYPH|nr:hypothetical protein SAMN04488518_108289 [Pseudovibrio ascidiaceicola]
MKSGEPFAQYFFSVSQTRLVIDNLTPGVAGLDCKSPLCKRQVPFLPPDGFEKQFATTFRP